MHIVRLATYCSFMEYNYEKLEVTKLARELSKQIYQVTQLWPKTELYSGNLGNQARRSAISVSLNIAEGSAGTKKDFARFTRIAIKSLLETRECLILSKELGYAQDEKMHELITKLYFKLINLRNSLLRP